MILAVIWEMTAYESSAFRSRRVIIDEWQCGDCFC